ncbi:hypothetical protein ACMFMG_009998 [Clarireedia jacksonii]
MNPLLFSLVLVAMLRPQIVAAHTVFTTLYVNDVSQGDGTCVRMPSDPSTATDPINDLQSDAMACGFNGTVGVDRVCSVNQASKLSFLFREYANGEQEGAIDSSHKGPCSVWMKRVASAINDTATGSDWFKIWEDGYDNSTDKWCTEKLMQDNGLLSVDLPSDLAGGYYLARPELLSLHEADKSPPNPQFYTGCAQIYLDSSATALPTDTVSIPGYVKITDESVLYNIYDPPSTPYVAAGPAPYQGSSTATTDVSKSVKFSVQKSQTEGLLPADAVITNGNWWGVEVAAYTTEDGCYAASTDCWAQTDVCYKTAQPTGDTGCRDWEAHCTDIQNGCESGNHNGPPALAKSNVQAGTQGTTQVSSQATAAATSTAVRPSATATNTGTYNLAGGATISEDGSCGDGQTCQGSTFGNCCSAAGYCGSSSDYCGKGCQSSFGTCE